jgi:NAD(P)-dependent dehydrogenase (short-subunit alcohol dehydrogenase family)
MEAVFKLNVIAPALIVKHFLPLLKKGEAPAVVNVAAGVASLEGNAAGGWYSYRASKTALNQLTKTMGLELARSQIRCVGLYPRMVETDLSQPYQRANPYGVLRTPDEAADKMLAMLAQVELKPVGRFIDIWDEKDIPW